MVKYKKPYFVYGVQNFKRLTYLIDLGDWLKELDFLLSWWLLEYTLSETLQVVQESTAAIPLDENGERLEFLL